MDRGDEGTPGHRDPCGSAPGTDAVCRGTQPHNTFCLEGIWQEGKGPGKALSRMAIPVLGCQVLVGWGKGLSPAQKLSELCSRLSRSCHLKSVPALGTPSLSLTFMLSPKCLSPSLIPRLSKARGLREAGPDTVPSPVLPQLLWAPLWAVCSSLHRDKLPENFRSGQGRMAGIPGSIGGYACPSPLTTTSSKRSLSGVGPGGPTENDRSRARRTGPGRSAGQIPRRGGPGPKPLWPRDSSPVGGIAQACAGSALLLPGQRA